MSCRKVEQQCSKPWIDVLWPLIQAWGECGRTNPEGKGGIGPLKLASSSFSLFLSLSKRTTERLQHKFAVSDPERVLQCRRFQDTGIALSPKPKQCFWGSWTLLCVADMQSSALKLYPSFEQKAMLLKRQAFAVFSGEIDQYHLYLPLIQGEASSLPFPASCNTHPFVQRKCGCPWIPRSFQSQVGWGEEQPDLWIYSNSDLDNL